MQAVQISSLNRGQSSEESISLTSVLFDFFDLHQHHALGSTHNYHTTPLAYSALQSQRDLLGGLGFLPEDGFGLTSITRLLAVISAPTLSRPTFFSLLVLGDLVHSVSRAPGTVGLPSLGNHHHF